jgi:hypothetical protein
LADINAYVRLLSGTGPGPYNIYYKDATNNNTLKFFEGPLTLQELYNTRIVTVPDTTKTITVKNINPACNGFSKDVNITLGGTPTPTYTPTSTFGATPTSTQTQTPTFTPTNTFTPTVTHTPNTTPTNTPTPSTPLIAINLSLTIDAGNTGYTRLYKYVGTYPSGTSTLITTLNTTTSTTIYLPAGTQYYVQTIQQSRQYSTEVAQINNYINGVADSCSPYIQATLNTILELNCFAQYTPNYYPTLNYGSIYTVNTFIGGRRPI